MIEIPRPDFLFEYKPYSYMHFYEIYPKPTKEKLQIKQNKSTKQQLLRCAYQFTSKYFDLTLSTLSIPLLCSRSFTTSLPFFGHISRPERRQLLSLCFVLASPVSVDEQL